jgi:ribonuclease R
VKEKKTPSPMRTLSGIVMVTRSGKGFLLQEQGDIPIPRERLHGALNGDVVEVTTSRGRFETIGTVTAIIERKTNRFVGTVQCIDGHTRIIPDDSRVYFSFGLMGSETAPEKHKVVIEIFNWECQPPEGRIREVIGPAGKHETEIRAIVAARGFDSTFSEAVLDEAQKLYERAWNEEEIQRREDFRNTLTFTIDPDTAKDFDDAISYKPLDNGDYEVGVHIADVSHFVTPGSLIDTEAFKRATSVYLVDRTIPMLPPQLSEDLCSLMPDVDRLTFSAVFRVTPQHAIVDRRFTKGIIRSRRRFTYDEADAVLEKKQNELQDEMQTLWSFADTLRKKRRAAGAVMFDSVEIRPVIDEHGDVVAFKHIEYTNSHKLIEELMLLANREVATYVSKKLGKKNPVFVYRTHDLPNQEKIEELSVFLRAIGYTLSTTPGTKKVSGQDLNRLLDEIEGTPEEHLIKTATVRSMAKAIYTTKNVGHYGLAFEHYAHFTSPIRRYPDLMVHRTLHHIISGEAVPDDPKIVEQRAIHASEKEAAAAQAERESVKMKQVEYFQKLIGVERDGVVSGITEWGIYIEDKETGGEGMARLATLTDDTYEYIPKKFAVVGQTTKKQIRLGDPIRFVVEAVNIPERQIDLKVLTE